MRRSPYLGVRGRVTLTVFAVSACLFSLLGTLGFLQMARSGRNAIRERVTDVLDQLESGLRSGNGTVQLDTADGVAAYAVEPGTTLPPADGVVVVQRTVDIGGRRLLLFGRASRARLADSLRSLHRGLWVAIPLASLVAAAMAGYATHRALRPVADITKLAASVGPNDHGARVPVPDTDDEIEHLAVTVNSMLERIEAGRRAQQAFTSDAAHELRTPLMALLGEIELARRHPASVDESFLPRIDGLTKRLNERVDDLVLLSRLDEAPPLARQPSDLLVLVESEASGLARPVAVSGAAVVADVDRALVARAARNLLANACRHAADRVAVTVAAGHAPDGAATAVVHVDDDGPGIAPGEREHVFERFARLDESRSTDRGGSGLGLAIVRSVARAHGGDVTVATSPLGGARFSLVLPGAATELAVTPSAD